MDIHWAEWWAQKRVDLKAACLVDERAGRKAEWMADCWAEMMVGLRAGLWVEWMAGKSETLLVEMRADLKADQ
jgi:hypothetical protein